MKKLFILSLMLMFLGAFQVVQAAPVTVVYDFEVTDGYGYDLSTGDYVEDITMSSTTKMVLSPANLGYELNLLSLNFHHMLFFDEYNRYIGYINGNNSTLENEWYLGYDATAITNYPLNAVSFTFVNYDYEVVRDQVALTNPTIDDIAYDTLSYRDIFGNSLFGVSTNNLIPNGDFSLDANLDNIPDGYALSSIYYTPTINNGLNLYYNNTSGGTIYPQLEFNNFIGNYDMSEHSIYFSLSYEFYTATSYSSDYAYWNFKDIYGTTISQPYLNIGDPDLLNRNLEYTNSFIYTLPENTYKFNLSLLDSVADNEVVDMVYRDYLIFDLTTIFDPYGLGNILPTFEEFETMLAFYEQYVDAPNELTYNDIFTNNLIVNGDFNNNIDGWSYYGDTQVSFDNGKLKSLDIGINASNFTYKTDMPSYIIDNVYYVGYDFTPYYNGLSSSVLRWNTGAYDYLYTNIEDSQTVRVSSEQIATTTVGYLRFYNHFSVENMLANITYITLDNVIVLDLTSVFHTGLEPDTAIIDTYYSVWEDPFEDDYIAYYTAGNLLALGVSWRYEPVIATDLDVDNGLDSFLTNINMNSVEGKAGIGIVFMIVLAITIGLTTKSRPIVIISLVTTFLGFTVIGWFPVWIVIILTILLVILFLMKMRD